MQDQQTIQMAVSVVANITATMSNMSTVGKNMADVFLHSLRENEEAKLLREHLHGGGEFCTLEGRNLSALKKSLDRNGIPYTPINTTRDSGSEKIIIRDKDFYLLDRNLQETLLGAKGGITTKDDLWEYGKGDLLQLKGLSDVDVYMIQKEASRSGIPITVRNPELNKYNVLFARKDIDQIHKITTGLVYDKSDSSYWKIREQEAKSLLKMRSEALKVATSKSKGSCWIVGTHGRDVLVSPYHVDIKAGKDKPAISYRKKYDYKLIKQEIARKGNCVVLTPEEYEKYKRLDRDGKDKFITDKYIENGFPARKQKDADIIKEHSEKRKLYERKLATSNPLNQFRTVSSYNEQVDLEGDAKAKRDNAEHVHDQNEIYQPNPQLLNDAEALYEQFDIDEYKKSPAYDYLEEYTITHHKEDHEKYEEFKKKDEEEQENKGEGHGASSWEYEDVDNLDEDKRDDNNNGVPDIEEDDLIDPFEGMEGDLIDGFDER